jgi:hypothetical protein
MAEPPTTRPNRWTGPPSTWRSYTKAERSISSSLDTKRSQDLSIHLYNAFAIKSRVRASRKGKAKFTGEEVSDFLPPDVWTAWPMPADEVPRNTFLPKMRGNGDFRIAEDVRPSADLEEALLATTTRIARERWRGRRWDWIGSKAEEPIKKEVPMEEDPVPAQDSVGEDEDFPPDKPMFSSQAADALGISSSSSEEDVVAESDDEADIERRPVPIADDDRARRILIPTIRHIISKADDLLEGLQKAREAYAGNWNKRKLQDTTTGDDTEASTGKSRSRSRNKSQQFRKRARASSVDSEASMMSKTSTSSRGRRKPKMKQLKLRDWSDVLGMAALTGWDPNVVQRAAERCSRLFGEDMMFHIFEEGCAKEQKSYFVEHLASGNNLTDSEEEGLEGEENEDQKPHHLNRRHNEDFGLSSSSIPTDTAVRCPVTTCPRHGTVYARSKNMYDHVRKAHPEVDIKALKKLDSRRRGDRRGKWDRGSRQRSSSVGSMSSV